MSILTQRHQQFSLKAQINEKVARKSADWDALVTAAVTRGDLARI